MKGVASRALNQAAGKSTTDRTLIAGCRRRWHQTIEVRLFQLLVLLVCCGPCALGQAEEVRSSLDSIEQRTLPCTSCHGKEGRATPDGYYPRIAGKPGGYLLNQLINFRDGHRHFPMMTYLVERQSDEYLKEMAEYFGNLHLPYAAPPKPKASTAVLARGRELVTQGDAKRRIPACDSCHGANLLGVTPAVPGLLGVSADYVTAQLGACKSGTRRAREPDCMAEIAQKLPPEDLSAVASWLASRTVPIDAAPSASFEHAPTLRCGSIPDQAHAP